MTTTNDRLDTHSAQIAEIVSTLKVEDTKMRNDINACYKAIVDLGEILKQLNSQIENIHLACVAIFEITKSHVPPGIDIANEDIFKYVEDKLK